MKTIRFNEALEIAKKTLSNCPLIAEKGGQEFVLIRDLYGRLRLLCPELNNEERNVLSRVWTEALGTSTDESRPLLSDKDFFDPNGFRNDPDCQYLLLDGGYQKIAFIDRGVVGSGWLKSGFSADEGLTAGPHPKRIVFFGLKGGVGRTTALCITARHLAKQGLKVLVLDMDLESPGLSSLLLPPSDLPPLGIIDWFMEDGLGQASTALLSDIVSSSPLASSWQGLIRVAPAFGRDETDYVPKLSRVYAELARRESSKHESFAERFFRMLQALEGEEKPDVVLLDSRAGMHDIAATLLVRLPEALRLLFASHSPQTWAGYHCMFRHWQSFPRHLPSFREGLQLVDALMPETGKPAHREAFSTAAYALFNSTLYENVPAGTESDSVFNYQESDSEAPHSAPAIMWDRKFMEFDPTDNNSSFHDEDLIRLCYGDLLSCIADRLQLETSSNL